MREYSRGMSERNDERQVRPIRIEDDTRLVTVGQRDRLRRSRRPWLPLVISASALLFLIGTVAVLGAVEFQDPPSSDTNVFSLTIPPADATSPGSTVPKALQDAVPGITDRLKLVTTSGDALWTLVWDPSFRVPRPFAMEPPGEMEWVSATFDAGGRVLAAIGTTTPGNPSHDVWFGTVTETDLVADLADTWSVEWHATEIAALAFVTRTINAGGETTFELWTTTYNAVSNANSEAELIASWDEPTQIIRWDSDGFVLQIGENTNVVGPSGAEMWSAEGWAHAASPNLIAQIREMGAESEWVLVDRVSGETTSFSEFGIDARPDFTSIVASSTNDLFAAATYRDDRPSIRRTTITVIGPDLRGRRIVQVDGHVLPYQFTFDTTFLILTERNSNDLVFVAWRTGATHVFDVPDEHRVLALRLG